MIEYPRHYLSFLHNGKAGARDTAIVMRSSRFEDAVGVDPKKRMKIYEVPAVPKETTWIGYG